MHNHAVTRSTTQCLFVLPIVDDTVGAKFFRGVEESRRSVPRIHSYNLSSLV